MTDTRNVRVDLGGCEDCARSACRKEYRNCWLGCCGLFWFIMVIFLITCWGYIEPTQYGLLKNTVTGSVEKGKVYEGGRHYIGWGKEFLLFPAHLNTLSFGQLETDSRGPIQARTGPAGDGDSSGGQPLSLSVSFQYKLSQRTVPDLYNTFGTNWEASYLRFAQEKITEVAQEFAPRSFWETRKSVEEMMAKEVNKTLIADGMAHIEQLQLTSILFADTYEQMIIGIQLQEQLRETKGFGLEVTEVLKQIDLSQAQTDAEVTKINAEGKRVADVIISAANAKALQQEQAAKAEMYAQLRSHMNWSQPQFLQYIKMSSLNAQGSSHVKLGVDPVGAISV